MHSEVFINPLESRWTQNHASHRHSSESNPVLLCFKTGMLLNTRVSLSDILRMKRVAYPFQFKNNFLNIKSFKITTQIINIYISLEVNDFKNLINAEHFNLLATELVYYSANWYFELKNQIILIFSTKSIVIILLSI